MDSEMLPIRYKRWEEVPEGLISKTALQNKGLKPGPIVRGTIYMKRRNLWIDLFDEKEAIPRKPASPQQLAALEKARGAQEASRTCHGCGQVYTINLNGCVCEYCEMEMWLDDVSVKAKERFSFWMERKDKYAVLDVETTGLDDNAEIVEIALVDLDETVLFHSLVRPELAIPAEATDIHGITDEMVENAPPRHEVWTEIRRLFASRTALVFNAGFDTRLMYKACRRNSLPDGFLDSASWSTAKINMSTKQ
jgi:DNA polymerase-3 subunit epsilon